MSVIDLTSKNIQSTIEANELVIIDFWAEWCGPCKRFAPVFEGVAKKYPNVVFAKLDTEAEQELAAKFSIKSIPTLIVIKESEIIFSQPGALPEEILIKIVDKALEIDMKDVRNET